MLILKKDDYGNLNSFRQVFSFAPIYNQFTYLVTIG